MYNEDEINNVVDKYSNEIINKLNNLNSFDEFKEFVEKDIDTVLKEIKTEKGDESESV